MAANMGMRISRAWYMTPVRVLPCFKGGHWYAVYLWRCPWCDTHREVS